MKFEKEWVIKKIEWSKKRTAFLSMDE
jgi:hypothetical protein